jgi:hypothetical protein
MKQHDYLTLCAQANTIKAIIKTTHKEKMFNLDLVLLNLQKNLNQEMNF